MSIEVKAAQVMAARLGILLDDPDPALKPIAAATPVTDLQLGDLVCCSGYHFKVTGSSASPILEYVPPQDLPRFLYHPIDLIKERS